MARHTIEVSETIYNLLNQQAAVQDSTLEKVIEHLLNHSSFVWYEDDVLTSLLPESVNEALAAVERLTNLFADIQILDLEQVLADPMIELANAELNMDLI